MASLAQKVGSALAKDELEPGAAATGLAFVISVLESGGIRGHILDSAQPGRYLSQYYSVADLEFSCKPGWDARVLTKVIMKDSQFQTHYPAYNVLDKWSSGDWDDQTREVVRQRLEQIPPIRFFTAEEAQTLTAIAERIVPQPDRSDQEKVPIVAWIDEKLHDDKRDGYRYQEMPPQREAWRLGLQGIDETAQALFDGKQFLDLDARSQDVVLTHVARGTPPGTSWTQVPASRFFRDVLSITIIKTYYAHPLAWNEIGYNGPSSPRGHVRKGEGEVDPWEAPDSER